MTRHLRSRVRRASQLSFADDGSSPFKKLLMSRFFFNLSSCGWLRGGGRPMNLSRIRAHASRTQLFPCLLQLGLLVLLLADTGATASGQATPLAGGRSEIFVDSDFERYLRYLQTDGQAALYPWSIRAFSPQEIDSILPVGGAHPWGARYDLRSRRNSGDTDFDFVR